MPKRLVSVKSFLARYPERRLLLEELAKDAEAAVGECLAEANLDIHQIAARTKTYASAASKLRRKQYGNPSRQLTDQVGVRAILYYSGDVDTAADALRSVFDVDENRSVDKRQELSLRQFGYRSLHLIARFKHRYVGTRLEGVGNMWFEIQVRSILEHSWAEIEHEICYKARIEFPDAVLRRFGAIAGTLEILEGQFASLRVVRGTLIDSYVAIYRSGKDLSKRLDAARLVAFLEVSYPNAAGWRAMKAGNIQLPIRSEVICTDALITAGIRTASQLKAALRIRRAKIVIETFASLSSTSIDAVSHLARCVIAIGLHRPNVLNLFPELTQDTNIQLALGLKA
jgi:ppGpp synthetase/RelA/SpoT-type nucleotidyltranferase